MALGTAITDRYDQCRSTYRSSQIVETLNLGAAILDEINGHDIVTVYYTEFVMQ